MSDRKESQDNTRLLVAVDFSQCSRRALRKAKELIPGKQAVTIVLHVIDQRFVAECVRRNLADEGAIKKRLFVEAKNNLKAVLLEEGMTGRQVKRVVCEGIPYLQINRHAEKYNVDLIVMGSCGMVGDTEAIFFGGTTEKVLRFISRPVLCVPPNSD